MSYYDSLKKEQQEQWKRSAMRSYNQDALGASRLVLYALAAIAGVLLAFVWVFSK